MKFSFSRKPDHGTLEQGVWVSLDDNKFAGQLILEHPGEGPAFRVASTESKRYKDAYDKGVRQYQRVIRSDRFIPWHIRERIENMAMQAAITDWIGVRDDADQRVDFDKVTVLAALENEPDFRKRAFEVAGDLALYKKQAEEEDAANLSPSSVTSLNGATPQTDDQAGMTPLH